MKQNQLSTGKRLAKPILFGMILAGLATAFYNRHMFFGDVEELRAQERERNNSRRIEVLERRHRQIEEMMEKRRRANSP